ncbi:hypothetical protein ACIA8K_26660 [Catenuloplanes sp. NPDC051500]|uniref:hypothetical protein n=1 Tax=Catenuloplanes sp. NPDC051500 TaxID=3363959 RepID=UPI003797D629
MSMRLRKQMRARRDPALPPAGVAALLAEVASLRAEAAAVHATLDTVRATLEVLRPGPEVAPADDVARDYVVWRDGPLLRLAKALTRRPGPAASADSPVEPPALARGNAMRALCQVLLAPATDPQDRHRRVGETVTELLGDLSWRNDAGLIRTLIEVRDGAATFAGAVAADEWNWPVPDAPLAPGRYEILPGSEGARVAAVAAPGLRGVLPLVVAG